MVGWTEIESPWTDEARTEAEALYEAELLICPHCGNPREVCSDPSRKNEWLPQRTICFATMARLATERQYTEKHEKAPYHAGDFTTWGQKYDKRKRPFHFNDGVSIWASRHDFHPGDDFL